MSQLVLKLMIAATNRTDQDILWSVLYLVAGQPTSLHRCPVTVKWPEQILKVWNLDAKS